MKSNGATRLGRRRCGGDGSADKLTARTMFAARRSVSPSGRPGIRLLNRQNFWRAKIATDRREARKLKSETARARERSRGDPVEN